MRFPVKVGKGSSAAFVACLLAGCTGGPPAVDRFASPPVSAAAGHGREPPSSPGELLEAAVPDTLRATNGIYYIGPHSPWYSEELLGTYPVRFRIGSEYSVFGRLEHGIELAYDRFHFGPFGIRGRYAYHGAAAGISEVSRYDGTFDPDRDTGPFAGTMTLTADFGSSYSASVTGRYSPFEGVVRPFSFDDVSVYGSGSITGSLDHGSGGILDSDLDLRFGDGLDHVLGVFAGEQSHGLDTVVFSGMFAAQTGPAPPPPPPEAPPPPPPRPAVAATLDCSAPNLCRGDNVDADDVRRTWNDPDSVKRTLALAEPPADGGAGLAARLGRSTPPLQSMARGHAEHYRGADGFRYHFGRSGGAGSLAVELDFSGAGAGLSPAAKASMRRAAKLWSWSLADDGRAWHWVPGRHGEIGFGGRVVAVDRPAGRETGVVIAVAEPTRTLPDGDASVYGAARPATYVATPTTFRARTGVVWLTSRLTDAVGSGDPDATAQIIATTAHEIGHVLGHADGIPAFDRHVHGSRFRGPNAMAANFGRPVGLQADGAHVDSCFSIMGYCHELGLEKDAWVYRPNRVDVAVLSDLGYGRFDADPSTDRIDDAGDYEGYSWSAWGDWAAWGVSAWRTLTFDVAGELEVTDELAAYADYFGLVTHAPLTARRGAGGGSTALRWEGSAVGVDVGDNRLLPVTGDAALDVTLTAAGVTGTATLDRLVRHEGGAVQAFREPARSYPLEIDPQANTFVADRPDAYRLRGGFHGPGHDEMAGIVNDREAGLLAAFGGRQVDP